MKKHFITYNYGLIIDFILLKPFFILLFWVVMFNNQLNCQTYNLVWSDEFNGTGAPDATKWNYETGYQRNNERQYYTTSTNNVRQNNGNLEITVIKEPAYGYEYTSGSIITKNKTSWVYGKIEGRFKMPLGKGLWPCFWTGGANIDQVGWPACGEIDIFEHLNSETNLYGTVHWADANNAHTYLMGNLQNIDVTQWHTYSIVWDPSNITWFVDGTQFHQVSILNGVNSTQEFHMAHFLLVNLPIGGGWPGDPDATTPLPATMYCDYIRVYQNANPILVTSVNLTPATATVLKGRTSQLTCEVNPAGATNKTVTWSSSNSAVATVSNTGRVTGIAVGSATISVTTNDGNKTASCEVTVVPFTNLVINGDFEADNAATQTPAGWYEWSSGTGAANASVLSVNSYSGSYKAIQTGNTAYDVSVYQLFSGLTNGNYSMRAWVRSSGAQPVAHLYAKNYGGTEMVCNINTSIYSWTQVAITNIMVTNNSCEIGLYSWADANQWIEYDDVEFFLNAGTVAVTGVSMTPATVSVLKGSSSQLTAAVTPGNASNQSVSWATNNSAVATVNTTGLVTAVAAGSATITVTTTDGSKTASCNVTVTNPTAGSNLVMNPGFEANNAVTQTPTGWTEWSNDTGVSNASATTGSPHSGTYKGIQTGTSAYNVFVYQSFTGITNGKYTFKAWVRSSGGQSSSNMYAKGFGGNEMDYPLSAVMQTWTQLIINDINVTNNSCDIGFFQWASANQWIEYDDVEFYLNTQTVQVTSVSLSPTSATLAVAATQQLTANIAPSNASNQTKTFSSSNTAIATVNAGGLVTAVAAGTATITVTTQDGSKTATCAVTVTPGASAIPGTIEAENYSTMNGIQTESCSEGTLNVGWIDTGDYLDYLINVTTSGTYALEFRVASVSTGGTFEIKKGSSVLGTVDFASTGGWQTWTTVSKTVNLAAGIQTIRLNVTKGGWNINWFKGSALFLANISIPKASSAAPTIDGNVDAIWNTVTSTSINNINAGTIASAVDCSGTFKALWDATNLYFLIEVTDDDKRNDSGTSFWEDDGAEIYIDINNDKATTYGTNDFQYVFNWNSTIKTETKHSATTNVAMAQLNPSTTSYKIEVKIPWATLGVSSMAGNVTMGLDVMIADDDAGGVKDGKRAWFGINDNSWQNPALFGTAWIDAATLKSAQITSGVKTEQAANFKIYPNPLAGNTINISLENALNEDVTIELLDLQGNVISSNRMAENHVIPVNILPGLYFVRAIVGKKVYIKKLIKQ